MTHRQLVEYLRTSSARCRLYADTASDAEAAQTLRQVADEMEIAILSLENSGGTSHAERLEQLPINRLSKAQPRR